MTTSFAIFAACGGAVAPVIGDGEGSGSSGGDGRGVGGGSGSGGGSRADGGFADVDGAPPDAPPDAGASDPGVIACGATTCQAGPLGAPAGEYCCVEGAAGGPASSCKSAAERSCRGHRLACDEAADCGGATVCCAERQRSSGGDFVVTVCRPTCITGAPRFQVCKTDAECENGGSCVAYDCGGAFPALRFCEKPSESCE
ncbi:MAG: hypothetical protein KF782_34345 [Labilithrix sp.]|nr:hypothetical protein [Labilithrix sp.]